MPTTDYPVVKIGTLFFIAIDTPREHIDLSDFSDETSRMFGAATIVDYSTQDMYRPVDDQDYVVVQIPFYRNGEMLNIDDVIDGELRRTLEYLHQKGLREDAVFPDIDASRSFDFNVYANVS